MNNRQLTYGTDYKTELDVVNQCLIYVRHIENVIQLKGLNFVDAYLMERHRKLTGENRKKLEDLLKEKEVN
ncbi:MAG: hypothetical protein ACI4VH_06845 [Clostridia bacterium]